LRLEKGRASQEEMGMHKVTFFPVAGDVISPMIPRDFPSCYHSSMRNLAVLFIHFIAVLARCSVLAASAP
jgi:hypothetical protein